MLNPSRTRRSGALLLATVVALTGAACSGEQAASDTAAAPDCRVAPSDQPTVAPPDTSGAPPDELEVRQLTPPPSEDCPSAVEGDQVAVDYVGRSWSTGEVFDSSETRGPFTFTVGAGRVIEGWDEGIVGLQVGERARLVIPPDLAYGEAGAGGLIGPDETLVFDIQVVAILDEPSSTGTPADGS